MDSFTSFLNLKRPSSGKSNTKGRDQNQKQLENAIVISFEDNYYDVHFGQASMDQLVVADLKERCKRITGVPLATMKLKVSGGETNSNNNKNI